MINAMGRQFDLIRHRHNFILSLCIYYGIICVHKIIMSYASRRCKMRTTIDINEDLIKDVMNKAGARTKKDAIETALKGLSET